MRNLEIKPTDIKKGFFQTMLMRNKMRDNYIEKNGKREIAFPDGFYAPWASSINYNPMCGILAVNIDENGIYAHDAPVILETGLAVWPNDVIVFATEYNFNIKTFCTKMSNSPKFRELKLNDILLALGQIINNQTVDCDDTPSQYLTRITREEEERNNAPKMYKDGWHDDSSSNKWDRRDSRY